MVSKKLESLAYSAIRCENRMIVRSDGRTHYKSAKSCSGVTKIQPQDSLDRQKDISLEISCHEVKDRMLRRGADPNSCQLVRQFTFQHESEFRIFHHCILVLKIEYRAALSLWLFHKNVLLYRHSPGGCTILRLTSILRRPII